MTPDLMEPIDTAHGRLHVVSDELLFSLTMMDDCVFKDLLTVCDGHSSELADTSDIQPYSDVILSLDTNDLEQLYVARDQRSAPYNNAFGVGGGRGRGGGCSCACSTSSTRACAPLRGFSSLTKRGSAVRHSG